MSILLGNGGVRNVKEIYVGVDGKPRKVKEGYVGVGGAPKLFYKSATPIGQIPVGNTVKIKENGAWVEFLVVHQGLPSTLYDSSCDGTWVLRKDIHSMRAWDADNDNTYENSDIHYWLNNEYLKMLDIQDAIKGVRIPYRHGGGEGTDWSGVSGLYCNIFLLSVKEVGFTTEFKEYFPNDGAKLDYFLTGSDYGSEGCKRRIAHFEGNDHYWALRSQQKNTGGYYWVVKSNGQANSYNAFYDYGIRPAFILPSTLLVSDDGTVT